MLEAIQDILRSFTNILTFLFSDISSITLLCLVAIELLSYLYFSRSLSTIKKQITDIVKLKNLLTSISFILWVVLLLFAIRYSHTMVSNSATLLSLGITVFLVGWLLRYPPHIVERALGKHRIFRGFLRSYLKLWKFLRLYINNPDLYGPWLEIVGITIVAKSIIFFIPAVLVYPIILGVGAIHKYRKLAVNNPHTDFPSLKDLIPRVGNIFSIVLLPFIVAAITGIITREYTIFYANSETAKSILFTLSQIEGSLGILAITVIFVLTQLTASNYSTRIPAILFRQPTFWVPLSVLFASLTYNMLIASRSTQIFPLNNFQSLLIDISFILAFATACCIAFFVFKAPRMVSPESIITDSLKSFDKKWLDTIKNDWCQPRFQIKLNVKTDPFIVIERILSKAVESGDGVTLISGLVLVRDHLLSAKTIDPSERPNYIIELDAYFHHHLRNLVRKAASNSDAYTLTQITHFIQELGSPSPDSITKCDIYSFGFDDAAGELLLREIIQQSISHQLVECVTRGIHIIESRADTVIKTLPKQADTWRFNQMKFDSNVTEEEKKRLWENDSRVENFSRQYISYLGSMGIEAANLKSIEFLTSVITSMNQLLSSITKNISGFIMKALVVRDVVWKLTEVTKALLGQKISDTLTLSMLQYAMEHTDEEHDESVAWLLVNYVSDFLKQSAKMGLLHYMNVVDSAMLGLEVTKKYTKPGIQLIKSMGEAAKLLKQNSDFTENRELQLTYTEMIQRIRQVGYNSQCKEPQEILSNTKSVLLELGEPELEKRSP